jgi:transcriptional regulator GlxA family with amidase domain
MQFSRKGASLPAGRSVLQEVQRFVAANPASRHSVASLAVRAGLSPRHFARLFHGEVGITPAAAARNGGVADEALKRCRSTSIILQPPI